MTGRVIIDLKQRTVGILGLLWNRSTPTRGAKILCAALYGLCSVGQTKITVNNEALFVQSDKTQTELLSSKYFARCLYKAGIREIDLPQGLKPDQIKTILNTLADSRIESARDYFRSNPTLMSVKLLLEPEAELEIAMSPNSSADQLTDLFHRYFSSNRADNPYHSSRDPFYGGYYYGHYYFVTDSDHLIRNPRTNPWHPANQLSVNSKILKAIAENPNTPDDLLSVLERVDFMRDNFKKNSKIIDMTRRARQTSSPAEMAALFAKPFRSVKLALAGNASAALELLISLEADGFLSHWERIANHPEATPKTIAMLINKYIVKGEDRYDEYEVDNPPLNGSTGQPSTRTERDWKPTITVIGGLIPGHNYDSQKAIDIINRQPSEKRAEILCCLAKLNGELHKMIVGKINTY